MMPADPNNESWRERLDRMERMQDRFMRDMATFDEEHRKFAEEHRQFLERQNRLEAHLEQTREEFRADLKMLLTAQVLFQDELEKSRKEADQRHKEMDERISVLIRIMDEHIRRNPLPPQ